MLKQVVFATANNLLPQQVSKFFTRSSFNFKYIFDKAEVLTQSQNCKNHLVVLDHVERSFNCIQLCKYLRNQQVDVPIIILLEKDSGYQLISALNAGADYYIYKPLNMHHLRSQLLAAIQRTPRTQTNKINVQDLVLNKEKQQLSCNEKVMYLKEREFQIFNLLAQNSGQILNRDRIHKATTFRPKTGDSKSIDVHISSLRKKLALLGSETDIQTVYGRGYRLLD